MDREFKERIERIKKDNLRFWTREKGIELDEQDVIGDEKEERMKPSQATKLTIEMAIKDSMKEMLAEVQKIVDEGNYPKDIFPDLRPLELKKINDWLTLEMGFPMDRLAAYLFRRYINMKKKELAEIEEALK